MKIKNKGKVHPSPSSSSSSSSSSVSASSSYGDFLDVLNCLPAAILALVSVLGLEDREVLAFMMRRSMETSSPSSAESDKKASKRASKKAGGGRANSSVSIHAPPAFNCGCFDCYMSYWVRWNSSPNGELIHQAIEAFEEQLATGEKPGKNAKGKRREKIGRRSSEKPVNAPPPPELPPPLIDEGSLVPILPSNDVAPATSLSGDAVDGSNVKEAEKPADGGDDPPLKAEDDAAVIIPSPTPSNHKGLARKVWPDVLGLFNSRLWSLWGPN